MKKAIFILIIFLLCGGGAICQNRQKLENEKIKLEKEIASMNEILQQTKKNKRMSSAELQIMRKKVAQRKQLVNNISSQISTLNSQIAQAQQNIGEEYKNLEVLKQNYAQMLRYAQKNRTSTDKLLFIFSAEDYHEAYRRWIFFRKSSIMMRKQMALIEHKTIELDSMNRDLISQKKDQNILLRQEKTNTASLDRERAEQEKVVKNIKKREKQITAQLKQAEKRKKKIQDQINAAINAEVKKQKQLAAKKRAAEQSPKSKERNSVSKPTPAENKKEEQYAMSATNAEVKISDGFANNRGRLPWPVDKGVIVSGFGIHEHPDIKGVNIENLGIDIRSTQGSAVRSVYDGQVCKVWSGPNGGKIVIIRHGEYMTVYTNLATVSVSDGTKVSMGQKIGTIATNENGQSEMNFQVRKGVKCQNPVLWLRR